MLEGKTCYELETKDGSIKRDIIYAANGEVMEIEDALKPPEPPSVALAALAATHPRAKIVAPSLLRAAPSFNMNQLLARLTRRLIWCLAMRAN